MRAASITSCGTPRRNITHRRRVLSQMRVIVKREFCNYLYCLGTEGSGTMDPFWKQMGSHKGKREKRQRVLDANRTIGMLLSFAACYVKLM